MRIWSLDPQHAKQPCAIILAGIFVKKLITIAWHSTGRYLLAGGFDTSINLFTIPEVPDETTGTDKPRFIQYPHFSTTEIHSDYVDCVKFYGDLILSKAANEHVILLWRIEGFDSKNAPPTGETARTRRKVEGTCSAFGGRFQLLQQFNAGGLTWFYMRFGLFHQIGQHPILAIGNQASRIYFWDLALLEQGELGPGKGPREPRKKTSTATTGLKRKRSSSAKRGSGGRLSQGTTESASPLPDSSASASASASCSSKTAAPLGNPFETLAPHKTMIIPKMNFKANQVAWSNDGRWCVMVGNFGMICVFHR